MPTFTFDDVIGRGRQELGRLGEFGSTLADRSSDWYSRGLEIGADVGPKKMVMYGAGIPLSAAALLYGGKKLLGKLKKPVPKPSVIGNIVSSGAWKPLAIGAGGYYLLRKLLTRYQSQKKPQKIIVS